MKGFIAFAAAVAAFAAPPAPAQADAPAPAEMPTQTEQRLDVRPATAAALAWLEIVDSGRYGIAWDAAAPILQGAIERLKWETTIQEARQALGIAGGRKLRSANYARALPNAPDGEYIVIEYVTHFQKRPGTIETVTPMRQPDGTWKVAGYFLR
jgi:hypothetical protein